MEKLLFFVLGILTGCAGCLTIICFYIRHTIREHERRQRQAQSQG